MIGGGDRWPWAPCHGASGRLALQRPHPHPQTQPQHSGNDDALSVCKLILKGMGFQVARSWQLSAVGEGELS
jgi:hypothetical protein